MKKIKFAASFFVILASVFYIGCGDSGVVTPPTGSGWHPNLVFNVNQQFVYSTDSLPPSGPAIHKRTRTTSTIQAQVTYQGELCYPVTGSTFDTATNITTPEPPYWIRYDQATGKYYQFGIKQLININQTATWDLVGDFDAARGTSYDIGDVNYTITLPPPYGNINFTGPLTGKIDSTTITTTGNPPQTIPCYKISMTASVSGSTPLGTVTATIILDYYLGYSAPTGIVELKLSPFSFYLGTTALLPQPGFDRKLYSHTP